MTKSERVAQLVVLGEGRTVLDLGCRDGILGRLLESRAPGRFEYTGLDLAAGPGVDVVGDVSRGLQFADSSFDVVTAIDVLEHLDDLQAGLDEAIRVARIGAVVLLPNLAYFAHRAQFLLTGRLGAKYDLALDYGLDRHRWLTVVPQIDTFMQQYAARAGYRLAAYDLGSGGRRSAYVEKALRTARVNRSWHAYSVCYRITVGSAS